MQIFKSHNNFTGIEQYIFSDYWILEPNLVQKCAPLNILELKIKMFLILKTAVNLN
jgi:hypothetical protein